MGRLRTLSREELLARFGRYGIQPYDWILEGVFIASVYPAGPDYLRYLRLKEGVGHCFNLAEEPWPDGWADEAGVECLHFPIVDMSVPDHGQIEEVIGAVDGIDGPVMVHCAAGLGRTGTMIALLLVERGYSAKEALDIVRSNRPGSIQTEGQERLVVDWAKRRGMRERMR